MCTPPPVLLRALKAPAELDRRSIEHQRPFLAALRKSITIIVNRVVVGNIKHVNPELFSENLIRGCGMFARSIMKTHTASLPFTPVFASLVSIINTKLPTMGELLLHRLSASSKGNLRGMTTYVGESWFYIL